MCLALAAMAVEFHILAVAMASPALAQTVSIDMPASSPSTPPAGPSTQQPTLAQAMAALPSDVLGKGKVMMAIFGGIVPAPAASTPSTPADVIIDPLDRIAQTYDRSVQTFGNVTAVAPKSMVVLNTSPDLGDIPFVDLAGQRPLPFLLGTLTPEQMHLLATTGLGFADLNADQQALLKAALPHPFLIVPRDAVTPSVPVADLQKPGPRQQAAMKRLQEMNAAYKSMQQTVSEDDLVHLLKLHAYLTADVALPGRRGSGVSFNLRRDMQAPGPFKLTSMEFNEFSKNETQQQLQSLLSSRTPNALKDGELDWKAPGLQAKVSLAGIKTVDDLVAAVAKSTGLELYVDEAYGYRPLDFAGAVDQPQSAVDLLQAVSLCVCGAWRHVGPACVLTDDVDGYGTRYNHLAEAVQKWSNRLTDADKAIGQRLADLDWVHQLHFMDKDPSTLPQPLIDQLTKKGSTFGNIAWKDVPKTTVDGIDAQIKSLGDGPEIASFTEEAQQERAAAQPDSPTWYSLEIGFAYELPQTGLLPFGQMPYRPQKPDALPAKETQAPLNLGKIEMDDPVRAVLCTASTSKEATALVDKAVDAGFNALYLDVFHNGRAYFPNATVKPESSDAAVVLKAAVDEATAKGVPVYAVVDLFCWRKDGGAAHVQPWPSTVVEDLTVSGEPADVDMRRRIDQKTIRGDLQLDDMRVTEGNHSWVSPFDPNVDRTLAGIATALASTKGIAGIDVEDVAGPGYVGAEDRIDPTAALGYTVTPRLAYLRANHVDPIDISPAYSLQMFLPFQGFQSSFDVDMSTYGSHSNDPWFKFRADTAKVVALDFQKAVRSVNPSIPLMTREAQYGEKFDPWPNGASPNTYIEANGRNEWEYVTSASCIDLPVAAGIRSMPWKIVDDAKWRIRHFGHGHSGGYVLDLVNGNTDEPNLRTLDQLAPYFAKPQNEK